MSAPAPAPARAAPGEAPGRTWRRRLGWVTTPVHLAVFGALLGGFHPAQVLARRAFGARAHERVVDALDGALLASLRLAGARVRIGGCAARLPTGRPLVVVANHQSMYDIPLLGWALRRHRPKYVAKAELGRGLPSVSYNLRHGGSVLIDRADARAALAGLGRFGRRVERERLAACIFPEGTRSRDGVPRPFKPAGALVLLRAAPSALLVPVAIDGSWELVRHRLRPIPCGVRVTCTVLEPVDRAAGDRAALAEAESRIRAALAAARGGAGGVRAAP